MDIGLLNVRITISKNAVTTDASGIIKMNGHPSIPAMPPLVVKLEKKKPMQALSLMILKSTLLSAGARKLQLLIPHTIVLNLVMSFMTSRRLTI